MKENFWSQESLVADIDHKLFLGDGVNPIVLLDVLVRVGVELVELLGDVGTHVAVSLFDCLRGLQRLFRWNACKGESSNLIMILRVNEQCFKVLSFKEMEIDTLNFKFLYPYALPISLSLSKC